MKKSSALLATAVGTAVYFLHPKKGAHRRAQIRDKAAHLRHKLRDAIDTASEDVRHRAQGMRTMIANRWNPDTPSDEILNERVRATIGHLVGYPGAIQVSTSGGNVALSGPVLQQDVALLMDGVLNVRGVKDVTNRLQVHATPGNISALQGAIDRPRTRQAQWSPTARLIGGVAGSVVGAYGLAGRGAARKLIGIAGLALLARSATNSELRRLATRRTGIDMRKSVRLQASVERIFDIWSQPENFPHFMTHVREVRRREDSETSDRWHWIVRGTSGLEFEFDSRITTQEPNRYIAWTSEPGSLVEHTGAVRFTPNEDGSTTAEVRMIYRPVAGAVGHVIAKLLGDDPKRQLDDDLLRLKAFLETGVAPRDAAITPRPAM